MQWTSPIGVIVTNDPQQMDRDQIHQYLAGSYWAENIPREICMKSLDHSVPFSVLHLEHGFVGFARLVTDQATFAYLADVFILESYRGKGLGKFLVRCINDWLDQHQIRTSLLLTRDAQSLYAAHGWLHPDSKRVMRYPKSDPNFYGIPNGDQIDTNNVR